MRWKITASFCRAVRRRPSAGRLGWAGLGWNLFLAGNVVVEPTWGDLPTFAQDPKTDLTPGKVGATIIPGVDEVYNPITKLWQEGSNNVVGNTNGGSRYCVISRFSKNKEVTYDLLAFMANEKNALSNCRNGWTGVRPGMKYEYLPPVGTGSLEEWKQIRPEHRRRKDLSHGVLR